MCGLGLHASSRLEIMEQMAVLQETSYEQLYRWAQSECRVEIHKRHVHVVKKQRKV